MYGGRKDLELWVCSRIWLIRIVYTTAPEWDRLWRDTHPAFLQPEMSSLDDMSFFKLLALELPEIRDEVAEYTSGEEAATFRKSLE